MIAKLICHSIPFWLCHKITTKTGALAVAPEAAKSEKERKQSLKIGINLIEIPYERG